jgi:hypothetical protein
VAQRKKEEQSAKATAGDIRGVTHPGLSGSPTDDLEFAFFFVGRSAYFTGITGIAGISQSRPTL